MSEEIQSAVNLFCYAEQRDYGSANSKDDIEIMIWEMRIRLCDPEGNVKYQSDSHVKIRDLEGQS